MGIPTIMLKCVRLPAFFGIITNLLYLLFGLVVLILCGVHEICDFIS